MGQRDGEQADGTTPASGNDAQTVARLEALAKSPDPMGVAFGIAEPTPPPPAASEAPKAAAKPATPPPVTPGGNPAESQQPKAAEPTPQAPPPVPDFDTASPEELRAWARQQPNMAKAMGLEVREHVQKRSAELQREQQARQQAEQQAQIAQQQAAQAADQARRATELYDAFYDEDDPRHLDALRFYAELGVAPMEIQRVIGSPVVQQHVGTVAQQVAQQASEQAFVAAIQAAASHPTLGPLGERALEDAWQESDGTVAGFYETALTKAGYLSPKAAADFRKAAHEEARTKAHGSFPPAEGSVVPNGVPITPARAYPSDKKLIDPMELFTRGFSATA